MHSAETSMDASTGQPPAVPLHRLRALVPAETALYWRLFKSAGGGPESPVQGDRAASLLTRSNLTQNTLREIWALSDVTGTGNLDFEGFCVACRLCAYAQQVPHGKALDTAMAITPEAPPVFEGADDPPAHQPQPVQPIRHLDGGKRGPTDGFDFEAVAFGADGGSPGPPSGPPATFVGDSPMVGSGPSLSQMRGTCGVPAFEAVGSPSLYSEGTSAGTRPSRDDAHPGQQAASATILEKMLNVKVQRKHVSYMDMVELIGRELIDGRYQLDRQLSEKDRLVMRVEQARARLEQCREERRHFAKELACSKSDVEHLFALLDFTRQQIERMEREVSVLREERAGFDTEQLAAVGQRLRRLAEEDTSSEGPTQAAATARAAQERAMHHMQSMFETADKLRRASRQKLDLHARLQLLLNDQYEEEHNRSDSLQALEECRGELSTMQTSRMLCGEERLGVLQEVRRLGRRAGLAPDVIKDLYPSPAGPPTMSAGKSKQTEKPSSQPRYRGVAERLGSSREEDGWAAAMSRPREEGLKTGNLVPLAGTGASGHDAPRALRWAQFGHAGGSMHAPAEAQNGHHQGLNQRTPMSPLI